MPQWDGIGEPIGEIAALKRQDMSDYAHESSVRVYRYVLPIMKKQNYRVHKLVEFLPKNECLLGVNVNHGQRISLRSRRTYNPREFLSFESILGTMLHESCHNTFGPHNDSFFKLSGGLTEQMEDMMARGFQGDQFMGSGNTLGAARPICGSGPSLLSPVSSGAGKSVPYQRPKKLGKGRKLGGLARGRASTNRPLRESALEAAERRRQADLACKTAQKVSDLTEDEQGEVIDLTGDDDDDDAVDECNDSRVGVLNKKKKATAKAAEDEESQKKAATTRETIAIEAIDKPVKKPKRSDSKSEVIYLLD